MPDFRAVEKAIVWIQRKITEPIEIRELNQNSRFNENDAYIGWLRRA